MTSLYSLQEGIETLSHFSRKYIYWNVIKIFWMPLVAIALVGSFMIAVLFVLMVRENILKPIKSLMGMTDLIMGKKK